MMLVTPFSCFLSWLDVGCAWMSQLLWDVTIRKDVSQNQRKTSNLHPPPYQLLLSKIFHSRPGRRQKILGKDSGTWGGGQIWSSCRGQPQFYGETFLRTSVRSNKNARKDANIHSIHACLPHLCFQPPPLSPSFPRILFSLILNGIVSCDSAAMWILIGIVRCQRPA